MSQHGNNSYEIETSVSRLLVIRHGQASFGAENYDQLSELGIEQSERLADYILESEPLYERIIVGPCQRHAQTAAPTITALKEKLGENPRVETLDALDEFDAFGLFAKAIEAGEPIALQLGHEMTSQEPDRQRAVSSALEKLTRKWARGDLAPEGIEPWASVRKRVEGALRHLMATTGRGETVAVFTSGGPTGAAIGMALGLSDDMAMKACWSVYNAGITDFLFTDDRISLNRFNHTPHLNLEYLTRR